MKLTEVTDEPSIFKSMLLKLVAADQPVYLNAKGRTFQTGNERFGYGQARAVSTGWVIQRDVPGSSIITAHRNVAKVLSTDSLAVSGNLDYAMGRDTGTVDGRLVNLERPVDDHYTIKKVDGTWTIVDKQKVDEQVDDMSEFLLKMLRKKMVAAGLETEFVPRASQTRGPYLQTPFAGFSVYTYLDVADGSNSKFFNAWFLNGRRDQPITHGMSMRDIILDIKPNATV